MMGSIIPHNHQATRVLNTAQIRVYPFIAGRFAMDNPVFKYGFFGNHQPVKPVKPVKPVNPVNPVKPLNKKM